MGVKIETGFVILLTEKELLRGNLRKVGSGVQFEGLCSIMVGKT